jgi:hypothetical protein
MTAPLVSIEDKSASIRDHEELTARRLARLVLEKPVPPLWMILMPIFFVFHAWRIKHYAASLKNFADNYMISRRKALDIACQCEEDEDLDPGRMIAALAESLPSDARRPYHEMMVLLIDHYRSLLAVRAATLPGLVKSHYHNKTNYMLYCKRLRDAEDRLNKALLPNIEGNHQDLDHIVEKMKRGTADLYQADADQFF